MTIDVRITRLPHGRDLPLPQYQTALAAGSICLPRCRPTHR